MNSVGWSVEGVPERDGRGELRAESLPKASFPGGRLWGFAIYGGSPSYLLGRSQVPYIGIFPQP